MIATICILESPYEDDGFVLLITKKKRVDFSTEEYVKLMMKKIFSLFLFPIDGLIGRDLEKLVKSKTTWQTIEQIHYGQAHTNILLHIIAARNVSFSNKLGRLINTAFLSNFGEEEEELSCRMLNENKIQFNSFVIEELVPFNDYYWDFLCPDGKERFFKRGDLIFCHFENVPTQKISFSSTLSLTINTNFLVSQFACGKHFLTELIKILGSNPFLAYYLMLQYEIGLYKVIAYNLKESLNSVSSLGAG